MAEFKLRIDRGRCIGSGNCVDIAPALFSQDEEDGVVRVLQEDPPEHLITAATEAVRRCPAGAIQIVKN